MSDLYVSWPEYHQCIETLAIKIYQSGWQFAQIVCLAKGGLRVGDILSRLFKVPLAVFSVSCYGRKDNRVREQIIFSKHLSMTTPGLGNPILLVDDLVDSGSTMQASLHHLKLHYGVKEMRTAVIWHKGCSIIQPDYAVHYLPDNPWIHQPFEVYELIGIRELLEKNQ